MEVVSLRRRSVVRLVLLIGAVVAAGPAQACRCAQVPLELYFERAEIVFAGEVTGATPGVLDGVEVITVEAEPRFLGRAFKGELAGVTLVTPTSAARCGVPVELGETYLFFASRAAAGDATAWFDSCSGSRLYAGGPEAERIEPFVGLPRNRIVPRLFELSGAAAPAVDPGLYVTPLHTSPACWPGPRTVHTGSPERALRERIELRRGGGLPRPAPPDAVVSPNGAYRVWVEGPETAAPPPWRAAVWIDVERDAPLSLELREPAWAPEVRWVSEKLLFVRVWWGRVVATDLLLDVERGVPIYEEAVLDGAAAFRQFQEQCAGQCPCAAVPGSLVEAPEAPPSMPRAGEPGSDFVADLPGAVVHLDADWDGRIYSEPGGRVSTLSELAVSRQRPEHPAQVVEVRETAAGPWLHVRLWAGNPCTDPATPVAHAGWVPAYSSAGALVAATSPGGC
jgi:hypothetical protein